MSIENLSALYAERAALAWTIEHAPGGAARLAEYDRLQERLRAREAPLQAPPCSVCGTRDFALAVGRPHCVSCALVVSR